MVSLLFLVAGTLQWALRQDLPSLIYTLVNSSIRFFFFALTAFIGLMSYTPSRNFIVTQGLYGVSYFATLVAQKIIQNTDQSAEIIAKLTSPLLKLFRAGKELWETLNKPSEPAITSEAHIEDNMLYITYKLGQKSWEIAIPYDRTKSRSRERPYLLLKESGERVDFSDHHPAVPFLAKDAIPHREHGWE